MIITMTWIRKFVTYEKMTLSSGKKKSDAILHKNNEKKGFWIKFFFMERTTLLDFDQGVWSHVTNFK